MTSNRRLVWVETGERQIPLRHLMWQWRPGSPPDGVPWSWAHEAADLIRREPDVMADLVLSVYENGVQEPVTLGYDGRVWDGHHRIVAALIAGRDTVPVDVYAEVMPS